MSKSIRVSTGPETFAIVTGDQGVVSVQNFGAADGQPIGPPVVLAQSHGFDSNGQSLSVDSDSVTATGLSTGGYEVVFNQAESDSSGFTKQFMVGFGADASGHVGLNLHLQVDDPDGFRVGGPTTSPQVYGLAGGRFAVAYETSDANFHLTSHVGLSDGSFGFYADATVASRPDTVSHNNGDVTLTWNSPDGPIREVLGEDGSVLMARGVSHTVTVDVAEGAVLNGFDPAHDQLVVVIGGDAVASGAHSTLTFNAGDHTLTWDGDSEGPLAASRVAVLPNADTLGVANLADSFRPEVLKVIAADGSSTIQWFDSENSQTWDTLIATETAAGAVKTYTSVLDDGARTVFTFDADNSQPYTRYVDQEDAAGRVLIHSVVLDDNESWVAKFTYVGGHVVSYEVDSFDADGHLVGQGFFNPDGSVLAH
jgi:hypothetical protein